MKPRRSISDAKTAGRLNLPSFHVMDTLYNHNLPVLQLRTEDGRGDDPWLNSTCSRNEQLTDEGCGLHPVEAVLARRGQKCEAYH